MIQIIGFLLCVYLVFKGVEIFQIGFSSSRPDSGPRAFGILMLIASIALAVLFALWLLAAGEAMNDRIPRIP